MRTYKVPRRCANTPGPSSKQWRFRMHPQSTIGRYSQEFLDTFWQRFDKESSPHGCWLWRGSLWTVQRYGRTQFHRKSVRIHRVAYEATYGPIPELLVVRHICAGNYTYRDLTYRRCGRPEHLATGTAQDNANDTVADNRQTRGVEARTAKLTPEQVLEIRATGASGRSEYLHLAAHYGVSESAIEFVVHRRSWKWM